MEAKKQGEGAEDLSMEDILQSIRKIIADEGDEKKPDAAPLPANSADASDILELTDMIEDEVEAPVTQTTEDILSSIDAALAPEIVPEPIIEPEPMQEPAPVLVEPPAPPATIPQENPVDMEALLSKQAEDAALAALSKLKTADTTPPMIHPASPVFRSGTTVEDMVAEMLKPMMKDWLDNNLPDIVERIVEREVHRLTRR